MPATRSVSFDDLVEVEFEEDTDGINFTDELFESTLVVRNAGEERVTGTIRLASELETTMGLDRDPIRTEDVAIDLEPGEVHRETILSSGMVGGSGTGVVVGVHRPEPVESAGGEVLIEPGEDFVPLASTVFWDRDFYRVNYLWPRRAQYLSVAFALLSAVLAGAIVWLSIG